MKVIYKSRTQTGKFTSEKISRTASTISGVLTAPSLKRTSHESRGATSQSEGKYFGSLKLPPMRK